MALELAEKSRAYLARKLSVTWEQRKDAAAARPGIGGQWLGALAQSGLLGAAVFATELTLDDGGNGSVRDEHGHAAITCRSKTTDHVVFMKTYDNGQTFIYVASWSTSQLAGYWYSTLAPWFAGIFVFTRVDCLTEESARALTDVVALNPPARRGLDSPSVLAAIGSLAIPAVLLWMGVDERIAMIPFALGQGFLMIFIVRVLWFARMRVAPWRRELRGAEAMR